MSQSFDASIPLLTEVLHDDAAAASPENKQAHAFQPTQSPMPTLHFVPGQPAHAELEQVATPPAPPPAPVEIAVQAPVQPQAPTPVALQPFWEPDPNFQGAASLPLPAWASVDVQQLEQRVTERVLQQLQGRIDQVLEQTLQDCVTSVLQRAVADLTLEIRASLQHTLRNVVSSAVRDDVALLQKQDNPGLSRY